ncbi:MAG: hypothetical protein AABX11_05275 [Nanoarchaeota archaeon]
MRFNKRAQFFLIAALIISGVILSFGKSYTQSSIQEENAQIYDLTDQFKYEASQILDNGVILGQDQNKISDNLKNLTIYYANLNPDSNIDIIYGNETTLRSISKNQTGEVISNPLWTVVPTSTGAQISNSTGPSRINVMVPITDSQGHLNSVNHSFDINRGQNFYLILRKKIKDQDVIIYR